MALRLSDFEEYTQFKIFTAKEIAHIFTSGKMLSNAILESKVNWAEIMKKKKNGNDWTHTNEKKRLNAAVDLW